MHYPLIQLSALPIPEDERYTEDDFYDDDVVNAHSDYVSGVYSEENRREFIKETLPGVFRGIAKVDAEKETVTLLDANTIVSTVKTEIDGALARIQDGIDKSDRSFYSFRRAGQWFRDDENIICLDGATQTSASFMEDCPHFAGQTFHIGSIISLHF